MAKEMIFPIEAKPLLEELVRHQRNLLQARDQGDEVLARLHEFDLNNTFQKLKITPCSICYHGSAAPMGKCHLWSRCQSNITVEDLRESDQVVYLCMSLNFQVI